MARNTRRNMLPMLALAPLALLSACSLSIVSGGGQSSYPYPNTYMSAYGGQASNAPKANHSSSRPKPQKADPGTKRPNAPTPPKTSKQRPNKKNSSAQPGRPRPSGGKNTSAQPGRPNAGQPEDHTGPQQRPTRGAVMSRSTKASNKRSAARVRRN